MGWRYTSHEDPQVALVVVDQGRELSCRERAAVLRGRLFKRFYRGDPPAQENLRSLAPLAALGDARDDNVFLIAEQLLGGSEQEDGQYRTAATSVRAKSSPVNNRSSLARRAVA